MHPSSQTAVLSTLGLLTLAGGLGETKASRHMEDASAFSPCAGGVGPFQSGDCSLSSAALVSTSPPTRTDGLELLTPPSPHHHRRLSSRRRGDWADGGVDSLWRPFVNQNPHSQWRRSQGQSLVAPIVNSKCVENRINVPNENCHTFFLIINDIYETADKRRERKKWCHSTQKRDIQTSTNFRRNPLHRQRSGVCFHRATLHRNLTKKTFDKPRFAQLFVLERAKGALRSAPRRYPAASFA